MKTKKSLSKFGIFAALPLSIFFIVLAVPFGQGLFLTFTDWDGFGYEKFIGVGNYAKSFQDPEFWVTLTFTLKFVLVSLVAVNAVAFGLALLVTAKLRSKNIFRTFFFVPNLIGGVVLGVIWQFIFNTALVSISSKFGWSIFQSSWLNETDTAFWALIIVTVWQSSGYMMIIYITGLISIEQDVIEAARVDGASALRTLLAIKVPLMAQAFTISLF
jgi:raffinose/stachyose/melibiose transport system permease protein